MTDHWDKACEAAEIAADQVGIDGWLPIQKMLRAALPHLVGAVLEEASKPFPYDWIVGNDVTEVLLDAAKRIAKETP